MITLEIELKRLHNYNIELLEEVHTIITVNHKNFNIVHNLFSNSCQLKIQDLTHDEKTLSIAPLSKFIRTNLNDLEGKKYKGDRLIK